MGPSPISISVMRGPLFDAYQAQDKAEAKGRAMLTGRRVPKSRMHGSPKLARGISAWLHCNRSNLL